jgi:hypothetical protein
VQLEGLERNVATALKAMENPPLSVEDWTTMAAEMRAEADEKGIDMFWYGAWGRELA